MLKIIALQASCAAILFVAGGILRADVLDSGVWSPASAGGGSDGVRVVYPPDTFVGIVNTTDTFDSNAWTIFNNSSVPITQVKLRFTEAGKGNFDDNLPSQASHGFAVGGGSSPMTATPSWADASTMP